VILQGLKVKKKRRVIPFYEIFQDKRIKIVYYILKLLIITIEHEDESIRLAAYRIHAGFRNNEKTK